MKVRAPARGVSGAASTGAPPEAKEFAEDIRKIHRGEIKVGNPASALDTGVAEAIIRRPFFVIREDCVGLVDLFEALFGVR